MFCAEGWGAGGDEATGFSFSPDCDVLSSFLSLPFLCCFFSFLKRCFSSFVNSLPSFCTTAQRTHYSLVQKRRDEILTSFEHEPLLVRCQRSRESLLQKPPVHSYLITPITKVGFTLCLWTSQTAPRSRHKAPFQWQLIYHQILVVHKVKKWCNVVLMPDVNILTGAMVPLTC